MMSSVIQIEDVPGMEVNQSPPTPFTHPALYNDIVVEEIISYLGKNPHELMKYRLVCHKWNDAIARKINKSGRSFKIPLRYGPQVPKCLVKSDAQRWAGEVLESVLATLTGSAARILFDTVVIDRDFYLAGIKSQWTNFLEIQGESIRHLKLKIRGGKSPKRSENHVTDCQSVVSMNNLRALFSSTPNLESLDFSVRFSNFGSMSIHPSVGQRMFRGCEIPQLQNLTKITIQEPYKFSYSLAFLKEVLSIAPSLTSLFIKPAIKMTSFALALKSLENQIQGSLTCLGISGAHSGGRGFPFLHLTKLEINNLHESGKYEFVNKMLRIHHSTLTTVILGKRLTDLDLGVGVAGHGNYCDNHNKEMEDVLESDKITPVVMDNLKILEINLDEFKVFRVRSYKTQFPVLESLTLSGRGTHTGCAVNVESVLSLILSLQTSDGPNPAVKEFTVLCRLNMSGKDVISQLARELFPAAEYHISG